MTWRTSPTGSRCLIFCGRLTHNSCKAWVLTTPSPEFQRLSISSWARRCFAPVERSCAYTRIFVSTSCLALMQFVPRPSRLPSEIVSSLQASQRPPPRLLIAPALEHGLFQPRSQHGADGGTRLSRQNAGLSQQICIHLERNVRFHQSTLSRAAQFYVPSERAANPLRETESSD